MTIPDPTQSRAVLIGTTTGVTTMPDLDALPAVETNLRELHTALTDGTVWALPAEHCVELFQPESRQVVLRAVKLAAQEASDTLLVYYAGHGLLAGADDELYLALPGIDEPDEGLRYEELRNRLRPPIRRGQRTVVILDCCYAGRAIDGSMGTAEGLKRKTQIEGVGVLAAAAKTRKALAPLGDAYTAFTGELLSVLREGDPKGPAFLDLTDVHLVVADRLTERRKMLPWLPEPQLGTHRLGGRIVLARNHAYQSPQNDQQSQPHQQPKESPSALAQLPVDRIAGLCRKHRLLVATDQAVSQGVVAQVMNEQVPVGSEELIGFYRWPRFINVSRGVVVTTWGVRLRLAEQRFDIPYTSLGSFNFKEITVEHAVTPDGAWRTTYLVAEGLGREFHFFQAGLPLKGPKSTHLVKLMSELRMLLDEHRTQS